LTGALASGGDPERLLAHVVDRIAGRLTVERCSLVLIEGAAGTVVASSDDPGARGMRVDLANYPEFREVMATGRPLVIDDAQAHPVLDPVRQRFAVQKISADRGGADGLRRNGGGLLFVRSRSRGGFAPREVGFLCTVASAAAVGPAQCRPHPDERLQREAPSASSPQLRRYEEFFSHVNDGMAVLDEHGRVLTLNPAGCAILGVHPDGARGLPVPELVATESTMEANMLWRELARGGRVLSAGPARADARRAQGDAGGLRRPLRSQNGAPSSASATFRRAGAGGRAAQDEGVSRAADPRDL